MDNLDDLVRKLNVPSNELKNHLLQTVLIQMKKTHSPSHQLIKGWDNVADILWMHLQHGLYIYDDQLLCAICFYSVMTISAKQEFYTGEIYKCLHNNLVDKDKSTIISLLYGMFQSTFLLKHMPNVHTIPILNKALRILTMLGYDYAWYTFLVFKTMSSFKKVIGTQMQDIIFTEDNQIKLFNLVKQNWENPITGIRDLNRIIFQTLIYVMDKSLQKAIKSDINSFYWNKAKYLMLSEVIAQEHRPMIAVVEGTDWVQGLVNSLHKPGLVSAGADMYFALLKKIATAEEWCSIFLKWISATLIGKSFMAIQNFTNYWCLTTLKTFPSLMSIILKEIVNTKNHERRLLSTLSLMKQGNRLGLLKSDMELVIGLDAFILQGLEHNNVNIRMAAFDIMCVSQGKSLPNREDYNLIYQYLLNNSNSDSTILRIHLLGSLKLFLIRLHMSFLSSKKGDSNVVTLDEDLKLFCRQIQNLVTSFLDLNGNYQRKVTSIKICDLIFTHFTEVPRKNRAQIRTQNYTLLDILKEKGEWNLSSHIFLLKLINLLQDPADDVREDVSQILLKYYFNDLGQDQVFGKLRENALKYMKNKFFFEISCGHSMIKLIANILLKKKQEDAIFKSVEDVLMFGCKELKNECELKRDVMESIQAGKQLHSYLGLVIVSLTVCVDSSYKLQGISKDTILELLTNLEVISNQFACEEETSISLDFSEMSDMVQNIISRSGYDPKNHNDRTKISGMHQLVLNCMWLNVKTCCELSSLLIKYNITNDRQADVCERCLNIITHVLETSRHKGAIEAAGAALGTAVQHLTTPSHASELTKLPNDLLKAKLNELINEAGKMSSVTRRGAGLSIMLHRIVASDLKKGKPLFHYFMKTLLDTCNQTEDMPTQLNGDIDNEKDLPKAIYIHFLTRIVIDSSLASDLMHYSASLGQLAFSNLTSKHWQIRNAALQLYGALVPKLIGQKKSGEDKETISTIASDEFRVHLPELWRFMLTQLDCKNSSKLLDHSDLVPILNMLANSARRYNFLHDSMEEKSLHKGMFESLICLLGSPIYTVRKLTAKCIFNNFPFEVVYSAIRDKQDSSENWIHGCLMLTQIYHTQYFSEEEYADMFSGLKDNFTRVINATQHSYVTRTVFEEIFDADTKSITDKVKSTFLELTKNKHEPGIHLWGKRRVEKCIKESSWHEFSVIIELILRESDIEQYGDVIQERMLRDEVLPSELNNICEALMRYNDENNYKSSIIWKILYEISLTIRISEFDIANIMNHFEHIKDKVPYKSRFMLPVIATFIAYEKDNERIIHFVNYVFSLTCEDFQLRYIAAMANNNLSLYFGKLNDRVKVSAIKTAVILLQDEDEDIRSLSVEFYENLANITCAPHPYICLEKLLKFDFLVNVLQEPKSGIQCLCNEITDALQIHFRNDLDRDQHNPFAHDSKNIYIEIEVIKMLIERLQNAIE